MEVEDRTKGHSKHTAKAIPRAIEEIKRAAPERYSRFSTERLRQAYYEALPNFRAIQRFSRARNFHEAQLPFNEKVRAFLRNVMKSEEGFAAMRTALQSGNCDQ